MKKKLPFKKLLITAVFSSWCLNNYSQNWLLSGNTNVAPNNITLPGNNFLGSKAGFNTWLQFGVNGSQDIFIDNNPAQLLPASTSNSAYARQNQKSKFNL